MSVKTYVLKLCGWLPKEANRIRIRQVQPKILLAASVLIASILLLSFRQVIFPPPMTNSPTRYTPTPAPPPQPGWPMYRHDPGRTGYTDSQAPRTNQTLMVYRIPELFSSLAVVKGVIFIGSQEGNLYALNVTNGALIWKYETDQSVARWDRWVSEPDVVDGTVFIGSGNYVYALNQTTGALIRRYETGGERSVGSPVVVDGVVYVSSYGDEKVYALNKITGALIWSHTVKEVATNVAVADGVVFVASGYKVYALDQTTGAEIWSYQWRATSGGDVGGPAVVGGAVFICSDKMYALNQKNGELIWAYPTGGYSSPAVADGLVFVGSDKLYALNQSTGNPIWSYGISGLRFAGPAVAGGIVFVTSIDAAENEMLHAVNQTNGVLIWSYAFGATALRSWSIAVADWSIAVADGVVFVGALELSASSPVCTGKVYAFGPPHAHDVAVTSVTATPTKVKAGEPVSIEVVVTNEGSETETFSVTMYYEYFASGMTYNVTMGTQIITNLAPGASETLVFTWDTTGVTPSRCGEYWYYIVAVASAVPGEIDTGNNTYIGGTIEVT